MCAQDYISMMINTNQIIYIDTASLMDNENLEMFIHNGEQLFFNKDRKIVVPRVVCLELVRHLDSSIPEKRQKAIRVLELFSEHKGLFDIQDENLNEEEAIHAFADSELLAELTRNRSKYSQLLITNDKRLGEDAKKLNDQVSCHGKKVMVCFINKPELFTE